MIMDNPLYHHEKHDFLQRKYFYIWVIYVFLKFISCIFLDFKRIISFPIFFPLSRLSHF